MPSSTDPSGTEEILAAIRTLQQGGGRDAFAVIFHQLYPPLHTFFANQSSLREEADDLAQKTLFQAYRNLGQFELGTNFSAWIRTIAENVWKNAVRGGRAAKRDAVHEPLELPVEPGSGEPARPRESPPFEDKAPTPEGVALKHERTRMLREALAALPPGMRQCTELRVFDDLEYQEIADVMGIGLGSVRSQLFEARKRLKPVLEKYFQGAEF